MHLWSMSRQYDIICSQFQYFTAELSAWYAHIHDLNTTPFWDESDNMYHQPEFEFGPSYKFTFFWMAQALIHYWGARILLYDTYAQALLWKHNLPSHTPSTTCHESLPFQFDQTPFSQHALDHCILSSSSSPQSPLQTHILIRHAQSNLATNIRKSLHYIWASDFGTCSLFHSANATVPVSRVFELLSNVLGDEDEDVRIQPSWMEGVKRDYEKMYLAIRELSNIKARVGEGYWRELSAGDAYFWLRVAGVFWTSQTPNGFCCVFTSVHRVL